MSNENDFNFCLQDISTLFIACLVPTYKGFDTLAKELDDKGVIMKLLTQL